MGINYGWESYNDFENRRALREEREEIRLRKLERVMQDYVGRPNAHSWANGSALFDEAQEFLDRVIAPVGDRARMAREEASYEAYSMREAEKLRQGFRPRRPKKATLSHVRPVRPVPPALVEWARTLGVSL